MTTSASKSFSLVKYDTPILISKTFGKSRQGQIASAGSSNSASTASSSKSNAMRTEDYLNSILPPREYQDSGQLWVQYVSPTPARETGICPIREELYSQSFDELIR